MRRPTSKTHFGRRVWVLVALALLVAGGIVTALLSRDTAAAAVVVVIAACTMSMGLQLRYAERRMAHRIASTDRRTTQLLKNVRNLAVTLDDVLGTLTEMAREREDEKAQMRASLERMSRTLRNLEMLARDSAGIGIHSTEREGVDGD